MNKTKSSNCVNIEKLDHYARGIAKVDGKTIFVENALPDEKVIAKIVNEKKKLI